MHPPRPHGSRLKFTTASVLPNLLCDLTSTTSAVCSLCTHQGLPGHVVCDIIQQTLEAGSSGPTVPLWVVHCLLPIVEADCNRSKEVNAVRTTQQPHLYVMPCSEGCFRARSDPRDFVFLCSAFCAIPRDRVCMAYAQNTCIQAMLDTADGWFLTLCSCALPFVQ